ncbi:MAG: SDR family NAD(P)-dependent oxidoreductase, partial [Bacteroidales bacterium]
MKILVTGGTGYIGSHTVVELMKEGFEVIIADNLSNSSIDVVDNITRITGVRPSFEKVDLSKESPTKELFNRYNGINAVIHFAAYKAVGESVDQPLKYYRNNLGSLINLLKEMNTHGIRDIVFSSSCTVYGQPDQLPVTEKAPIKKAASPYGNTKQIAEEIIGDVSMVSSLQAILLR